MIFGNIKSITIPEGEVKQIVYNGTILWEKISCYLKTITGKIITITDALNEPAESLKVTLEPIQSGSGTPSPDNVRPISGHTEVDTEVCGVNIWDEEWEVGTINNTTGLPSSDANNIRAKNYCPCKPNTSYFFYSGSGKILRFYWYDAEQNYISTDTANNAIKASPDNAYYFKVRTTDNYGDTYNHDISINYPSTDHAYHAHDGHTYTTTLGRTVYGGTLDVVSGELVVDRAMADLGTLNWTMSTTGTYKRFYSSSIASQVKPPMTPTTIPNIVSSQYEAVDFTTAYRAMVNGVASITDATSGARGNINVVDDAYSDTASFKTAMNGVMLVYELATPQTYQLDPQTISLLHGNNNVWSDGEVELTYWGTEQSN